MLTPGEKIGPYTVVAELGAGGMGVVYRARDERLGRDVALKVLHESVAGDAQRMARFQREAQVLAALNHPNIAAIYGIEWAGATSRGLGSAPTALVMELVEGLTLAERIGPRALSGAGGTPAIPMDEALPMAKQIAEALEYAHEKGIIHRDLKPANIKLTKDGNVKVLDFGLAKALTDDVAAQDISASPTLSVAATKAGFILGTAAYMSPEQARGKSADRRADVWSFGVVLLEMLTGTRAFAGEDISITLANVIKEEPDWHALPANTPRRIRELLRRCLAKDARQRLQAIGEARIALEEPFAEPVGQASAIAMSPHAAKREKLAWGMAATLLLVAGILGWLVLRGSSSDPLPVRRSVIALPETEVLPPVNLSPLLALSPDGSNLAFMASRRGQGTGWQLYLRPMDQMEARPLDGTDEGQNPFFSPDGKWIGFFGGGKLRKISVQGGAAATICEAVDLRGAAWGRDDTIIFSRGGGAGLFRVPAAGGTPQPLTTVDPAKGDFNHRWPHLLPDGQSVLFTSQRSGVLDDTAIEVLTLQTGQRRILLEQGTGPQYAASGHIIFYRGGALHAVPFDARRLEITGPSVPVVENVWGITTTAMAHFSLAADGTLAYAPGGVQTPTSKLAFADRKGTAQLLLAPPQAYVNPVLSPDGRRVAMTVQGPDTDVWVFDIVRGALSRLTFQPGEDEAPAWTPDGRKVAYSSDSAGKGRALIWKNADGSGTEEILWVGGTHTHLGSFSPDSRFLAFVDYDNASKGDIWVLPLAGDRKPAKFLQTPFNERSPAFSPDGRWIAYTSDDSGHDEVYVQPFPGPGGKWQVSTGGGFGPAWARNGRELFYQHENKMMVVAVASQPSFSASVPRQLFERTFQTTSRREANYDVTPDAQRFLMIQVPEISAARTQLVVVTNWFGELKRLAPPKK